VAATEGRSAGGRLRTGEHRPARSAKATEPTEATQIVAVTETADETDGGETDPRFLTGHHRAVGKSARRRIAKWPIACAVLVALVGLAWLGFSWAASESNTRAEAQAAKCTDGDSNLNVIVTPSAEKAVTAAAQRWNDAKTVVHAHCINVHVKALPSEQVLSALRGENDLAAIGGMPTAWIAESAYWVDELTVNKPELIGSPPQSVASARSADYRYLALAGNGIDDVQKRAAQSFRGFLTEPAQQADFTAPN